jgi:hypothetical protein
MVPPGRPTFWIVGWLSAAQWRGSTLRVKAFMTLQILCHQNIFTNVLSVFIQYVNWRRTICITALPYRFPSASVIHFTVKFLAFIWKVLSSNLRSYRPVPFWAIIFVLISGHQRFCTVINSPPIKIHTCRPTAHNNLLAVHNTPLNSPMHYDTESKSERAHNKTLANYFLQSDVSTFGSRQEGNI